MAGEASYAQQDTVLQEVNIKGKQNVSSDTRVNDFSPGQKITTIDSITLRQYQLQNIANMLAQQTPVFVKSYGFNGLATLNFRGSSSAQSAVYWNGIPIQNAALGIADVSTLPVLFMNKVNIVYGGSSAMLGSGNVGGALLLESDAPVFEKCKQSLVVSGGVGSFSQYSGGIKGYISNKRWFFSANVFGQDAKNDFRYSNGNTESKMLNSHLRSGAAMAQAAYKINERNTISLIAWGQQYAREIPPALFESYSAKKQVDASVRLLASWQKQASGYSLYAKSAFIRDEIHYDDPAVQLNTQNVANQYYGEVGYKKQFYRYGQLLAFVPLQISWIDVAGQAKFLNKGALAAAYNVKFVKGRLDVAVNQRMEILALDTSRYEVLLPGASAAFDITDWLRIRANIQRSFRAPTLNELYYNPGGNASLKPERGWSEDVGYDAHANFKQMQFIHSLSLFNRNIHDWIMWLGGAIWTPHNIATVHSRGVETENKLKYRKGRWVFHAGLNTSYVLATTVKSYILADGSIGKQIPYTPRYNGQGNVGVTFRQFYFNYNHTYTGYRFTRADESDFLLPYTTGNIQVAVNAVVHKQELLLTMQCNNVWDENYSVVRGRPMPGTNWQLGIKLGLL
jgi:iron complex outermembrane receptor protein